MSYKNELVENAVNALRALELEFTERKAGQQYRAVINTIAYTFPEDKEVILASYIPAVKQKKTGKAKIIRSQPKEVKSSDSGCADCPPDNSISDRKAARMIGKGSKRTTTAGEARKTETPVDLDFESVTQVVESFEGDTELMLMFCKAQQINVGKATTAEGIAKKIFDQLSHSGE